MEHIELDIWDHSIVKHILIVLLAAIPRVCNYLITLFTDMTDEAAVKAIYDSVDDAVESINVSFVMENQTSF